MSNEESRMKKEFRSLNDELFDITVPCPLKKDRTP